MFRKWLGLCCSCCVLHLCCLNLQFVFYSFTRLTEDEQYVRLTGVNVLYVATFRVHFHRGRGQRGVSAETAVRHVLCRKWPKLCSTASALRFRYCGYTTAVPTASLSEFVITIMTDNCTRQPSSVRPSVPLGWVTFFLNLNEPLQKRLVWFINKTRRCGKQIYEWSVGIRNQLPLFAWKLRVAKGKL